MADKETLQSKMRVAASVGKAKELASVIEWGADVNGRDEVSIGLP